jgi:hypothetical protein
MFWSGSVNSTSESWNISLIADSAEAEARSAARPPKEEAKTKKPKEVKLRSTPEAFTPEASPGSSSAADSGPAALAQRVSEAQERGVPLSPTDAVRWHNADDAPPSDPSVVLQPRKTSSLQSGKSKILSSPGESAPKWEPPIETGMGTWGAAAANVSTHEAKEEVKSLQRAIGALQRKETLRTSVLDDALMLGVDKLLEEDASPELQAHFLTSSRFQQFVQVLKVGELEGFNSCLETIEMTGDEQPEEMMSDDEEERRQSVSVPVHATANTKLRILPAGVVKVHKSTAAKLNSVFKQSMGHHPTGKLIRSLAATFHAWTPRGKQRKTLMRPVLPPLVEAEPDAPPPVETPPEIRQNHVRMQPKPPPPRDVRRSPFLPPQYSALVNRLLTADEAVPVLPSPVELHQASEEKHRRSIDRLVLETLDAA